MSPSSHSLPHSPQRSIKLSWNALLSFPYRMCNPPPAVGNVRSCQVTPVVNVKLDDVLNRKHLPPLGLKDFEEWLLFVEQCPENLYFILWLKEYTLRYEEWISSSKRFSKRTTSTPSNHYRVSNQSDWPKTNPSLAIFYARAKQTFFTPNSVYELNLPSDILGRFHAPAPDPASDLSNFNSAPFVSFSPHPDPALFNEVAFEVHTMLEESLDHLVKATFNNVGTGRGICGLVGGAAIALLGSVAPIVDNFVTGRGRWLRLLALPGLWLGLTIVLASLHGVCMMIYIFGDLRQLTTYELQRPSISPPRPLRNSTTNRSILPGKHFTTPVPPSPAAGNNSLNIPKPAHITRESTRLKVSPCPTSSPIVQSSILALSPTRNSTLSFGPDTPHLSFPSSTSVNTTTSNGLHCSNSGSSSDGAHAIHISEAYYDDEHRDEGIMSSPVPSSWNSPSPDPIRSPIIWAPMPSDRRVSSTFERLTGGVLRRNSQCSEDYWTTTASFIHPYDYAQWQEALQYDYDAGDEESRLHTQPSSVVLAHERQRVDAFDFDALPPATRVHGGRPRYRKCVASPPPPLTERDVHTGKRILGPADVLMRFQGKCGAVKGLVLTMISRSGEGSRDASMYQDQEKQLEKDVLPPATTNSFSSKTARDKTVAERYKKVSRVPAFKTPLTSILSPVVTRAQWEIVVRSTVLALFISLGILAGILAAPVVH